MDETVKAPSLSPVLVTLFKGVLYHDEAPDLWQDLLRLQPQVRDQAALFGLELRLDESEGHAYLRQRPAAEGEPELPRLVQRRQLGYSVSLLLVLLRKKLVEHDAGGADARLVLSQEQIAEMIRLFLPDSADEARLIDRLDTDINRVVELGFLRALRGQADRFEVRRILKAFVDAQWLSEFEQRLAEYRAWAGEADDQDT